MAIEHLLFHPDGRKGPGHRRAAGHLRSADARMKRLVDQVGPFRLVGRTLSSPYEELARAIFHQQLAGSAARAIMGRVQKNLGRGRFPSAKRLAAATPEELRTFGVSRPKALALIDLAQHTLQGTVPTSAILASLSDAEIVERLTQIRGIGQWTVEMLLIFGLGRPDVLPASDYGVRKGFQKVFKLQDMPTPGELLERGERWRPFRSAAAWYLWRSLEL